MFDSFLILLRKLLEKAKNDLYKIPNIENVFDQNAI